MFTFVDCPILWCSKLQTLVAISSTKSDYVALLQYLREVIYLVQFLHKFNDKGFTTYSTSPKIFCKDFEGNSGALDLSRTPNMRPCMKYANIVYHHLREFFRRGIISVYRFGTTFQLADISIKPFNKNNFLSLLKRILHFWGWLYYLSNFAAYPRS